MVRVNSSRREMRIKRQRIPMHRDTPKPRERNGARENAPDPKHSLKCRCPLPFCGFTSANGLREITRAVGCEPRRTCRRVGENTDQLRGTSADLLWRSAWARKPGRAE